MLTWRHLADLRLVAMLVAAVALFAVACDTIASVGAGSDQVIVLVNDNSTGNDQIIATADIQSIEDLAGKTIGIEVGVVDHFLLLLGLESVGLTATDVEIVNLETGAAAAAFASGQLDAVGVFAPFTT